MKPIDNRSIRSLVMATALSIGLVFVTHASAQIQEHSYLIDLNSRTATDLGDVSATAINDAGQVVGYSGTADGPKRAFITGPNGAGMTDLGTLRGGSSTYAYGINNEGQVVGYSTMASGQHHAFITGPNGVGITDLGTLPGGDDSHAWGINDAGRVVGGSTMVGAQSHGFITGPNGVGMTDLGKLPGTGGSDAIAVNDAGQVVGLSFPSAFITGPNGVGMMELGTRGNLNQAVGINGAGQVAGWTSALGMFQSFITGPNGVGMTELGTLPSGYDNYASAINDGGQVVGYSFMDGFHNHAFITGLNGMGMTDLNSLMQLPGGLMMDNAIAINNMGQVLVSAAIPAVFIPAVPEPESYALMLAGLLLTGAMVRRKQKAEAREEAASVAVRV